MTTISEPPSQPESLDLDYDMWQGQFEFVGNGNTSANSNDNKNNSSQLKNKNSESLEDLNFNNDFNNFKNNKPILVDEETFLSFNQNDFVDDINNLSIIYNNKLNQNSGPNSMIFIDNNQNQKLIVKSESFDENIINNKLKELNNNNNLNYINNNNTNNYKIENLKNLKNKLILSDLTDKLISNETDEPSNDYQQKYKNDLKLNNGLATDLCDNLNEQLELLQRQVTDLADTQNTVEDRTTRTKTEYAVLQARYHMLEEQYRESELRAEERLVEEQKRSRELLTRVEREASLQNENCQIKIHTIEFEANALKEEAQRLRVLCDKQANDLHATEEKLEIARESIALLQLELNDAKSQEKKYVEEKRASEELMLELSKELERLKSETGPAMPTTSPETLRLEELHIELEELRQQRKLLEEQNEELQAAVLTRGVEEGRHLLNGTLNSLAQELEEMTQTQDSVDSATLASLSQLQQAFQDKEDENQRLKNYIDTILLNIVENYPQLLEVKTKE